MGSMRSHVPPFVLGLACLSRYTTPFPGIIFLPKDLLGVGMLMLAWPKAHYQSLPGVSRSMARSMHREGSYTQGNQMRVGGRGNLDHLSQLWQLQNSGLAAQQQASKVDRYKQVAMSKDELGKIWKAGHQEKRKRSRRNPQARPTASLANHKQEKARIGALTDGGSAQTTQNTTSNPFADLAAIGNALQSGDLTGAQNAFATLMQDMGNSSGQSTASTPGTDLTALSSALQSGDLTGAQNAFATLMQDLQNSIGTLDNSTGQAIGTTVNATA
jgi:hypothetical protein